MRVRRSRRRAGYRRTAVLGATSALALLAGLGPASSSGAVEGTTPAPASAAGGVAKATALVARVAPGVGSLELALGSGIAVAELQNQLAQAQAQSFDLGLIGTTLTAEGCDGGDGLVPPSALPQPTRVDNRGGDRAEVTDEAPIGGSSLGAGRESARATTQPSATAVATVVAGDTPVLQIAGGTATAHTEVLDDGSRQAVASVEVDLTIGGVVKLTALRWDAVHRSGGQDRAEASFTLGGGSLGGVPLPLDDLTAVQDGINALLGPTGVTVELPRVERLTEPTDLVRVTPLRIVIRDSELGGNLLGPVLNASRAQREQLFDELTKAYCTMAGVLLVGDVGVSVASGTGFLVTEIGGAEAISGDFVATNPFGELPAAPVEPAPPVTDPPAALSPGGPSGGAPPPAPPSTTAAPATSTTPTQPVASLGPLERLCESVHPLRSPACSEGALAPLGMLGLLATGVVAGLDWRHQRRTARPTPAGAAS